MRTLVLLQGIPASGKSTFIREHHLEDYTLSFDALRVMASAPEMTVNGFTITDSKFIYKFFDECIENRMSKGHFTVIDNTFCNPKDVGKYKQWVKKYHYRAIVVRFSCSPEEAKRRNATRGAHMVPEEVIDRMYNNLASFEYESWMTVISPEEYDEYAVQKPTDLSEYKEIVHIGDIHGCYDALRKLEYDPEKYYVFLGDYFDRGAQNAETAKALLKWAEKKNVVFLYGNHERHIRAYFEDGRINNSTFAETLEQFSKGGFDVKKLKPFLKKMQFVFYYEYYGRKVVCSHAGIPFIPGNLRMVNNQDFYKGIGGYGEDVDKNFVPDDGMTIQVHGHRNLYDYPYNAGEYSYNLNTGIEFGEPLRVLRFTPDGKEKCDEYSNTVLNERYQPNTKPFYDMLLDDGIIAKHFGPIVCFNFSRDTFWERRWKASTIMARGMFCDENTKKVVARGYEKFFEIGENEITSPANIKKLQYPLSAYRKENGYLGILSSYEHQLLFCSKGSINSDFALWFKEIFMNTVEHPEEVELFLRKKNCSFVFEVIDAENDTHIINYGNSRRIVLLDCIENSYKFSKHTYSQLCGYGKKFGIPVKQLDSRFGSFEAVESFVNRVNQYDYSENGKVVEGYVFEDVSGEFHFKVKSGYYKFWKAVRNCIEKNGLEDPSRVFEVGAAVGLTSMDVREIVESYKNDPCGLFELEERFSELKKG